MIKLDTFTPQGKIVRKVSDAAKNIKASKQNNIGISGLPYEVPLDTFKEKKAIQMLNDSFSYNKAKDSVTIATYEKK